MNASITNSRRQALRSASHWYAVLSGERVSPQQEARWQQWYEEDKEHQWAWQQVANLRSQLSHVPANVASRVLHDTHLTRRHVLKGLLLLLGVGGAGNPKLAKVFARTTAPTKARSAISC